MLNSIERFRTIVDESFLDRGTVRRGGSILKFVQFAYELKICCCIFFVWKRRHRPKRPVFWGGESMRMDPRGRTLARRCSKRGAVFPVVMLDRNG